MDRGRTRFQCAQDDQRGICNVQLCREAPSKDGSKAVDRQKVDDERVAPPGCNLLATKSRQTPGASLQVQHNPQRIQHQKHYRWAGIPCTGKPEQLPKTTPVSLC
jgi:hypothetical protein